MSQTQFSENEQFAEDVDRIYRGEKPATSGDEAYQADLEFADLLNRASFTPNQAYKTQLHVQLVDKLYQQHQPKEVPNMFSKFLRSAMVAVVATVLLFAVVFAASPDARAATQQFVARYIGVGSVNELLPEGEALPSGPPSGVSVTENDDANGRPQSPAGSLPIQPSDTLPRNDLMTLEEAQNGMDFTIKMPSYLPEGYSFLGAVPAPELPEFAPAGQIPAPDLPKRPAIQKVQLMFGSGGDDILMLSQAIWSIEAPSDVLLPAGEGSIQDVTVNGQPAQFVDGAWTEQGWVAGGLYRLHWEGTDGITYDLTSTVLGLEELLAIAESIQ
jgi:hypothetical protein